MEATIEKIRYLNETKCAIRAELIKLSGDLYVKSVQKWTVKEIDNVL